MKRIIALVMLILLVLLTSCHEPYKREDLNDINLFITEDYAKAVEDNGESIWWKKDAGVYAKEFFPKYDEIKSDDLSLDFFVRYYENATGFLDAALVLELSFDSAKKYDELKTDIYSNYTFLEKMVRDDDGIGFVIPIAEFQSDNYLIRIVTNGECGDDYPNRICVFGFNDTDNVIKYIYLYDSNRHEIEESEFKGVIKSLL